MDFLTNNNFVNILVFCQLPNIFAVDSFDNGFFTGYAIDIIFANYNNLLLNTFLDFQDILVQFKD